MLRPVQSLAANLDHNTPTGGHKHERKCLKAIGFAMFCLSFTIDFFHAGSVSKKCPETGRILLFEGGGDPRKLLQDACCFGIFPLFCKFGLKWLQRSLVFSLADKKTYKTASPCQKKYFGRTPPLEKQTKRQLMVRRCQAKTNGDLACLLLLFSSIYI